MVRLYQSEFARSGVALDFELSREVVFLTRENDQSDDVQPSSPELGSDTATDPGRNDRQDLAELARF
jgi:hypothetical protein